MINTKKADFAGFSRSRYTGADGRPSRRWDVWLASAGTVVAGVTEAAASEIAKSLRAAKTREEQTQILKDARKSLLQKSGRGGAGKPEPWNTR